MQILSISLEGFRSFSEPTKFTLARSAGLVLVTGRNKVDAALGANGVGKTTLFDAITFALYGQTGRGERGPRLVADGSTRPAVVILKGKIRDQPFRINRHQSPNHLTLMSHDVIRVVTQPEIDAFLGMNYNEFLRGCYHVQGTIGFIGLKPQGMLDEFSNYLNLDVYDEAQQTAQTRWSHADQKKRTAEQVIESNEKVMAQLRQNHSDLTNQAHEEARAKLSEAKANAVELAKTEAALLAAQRRLQDLVGEELGQDLDRHLAKAESTLEGLRKLRRKVDGVITRLVQRLDDLEQLQTKTKCPTCGQPWDRSEEVAERITKLQIKLNEAKTERKRYIQELADVKLDHEALQEKLTQAAVGVAGEKAKLDTEIDNLTANAKWLQRQASAIAQRPNAAMLALNSLGRTIKATEEELQHAQANLAQAAEDEVGYGYWRRGFKLLKLEVISKTVAQFQAVADDNLAALGMRHWALKIDADSALDGRGKLKIELHHRSGAVRTTNDLSFGENQRVKIAVDLAVGDVCLAANGITTNVEFWDEPMTWLSATGINMFLEMLDRRATTLNRTIYVSDHRTLDYEWSEIINIVRTSDGSRIDQPDNVVRLPVR